MKTIAPNIKITEAEEEPMKVEEFQSIKKSTFASDVEKRNDWEQMSGVPDVDWLLIIGKVNGEDVSTHVYSEYSLSTKQYKEILGIIYSCKGEQITKQFDEALKVRILNVLKPDVQYNAKVVIGYDFDMGLISGIAIYPKYR